MGMNYNGRVFRPVENTPNGEVNGATLFEYRQSGELLEAGYSGGGIRCGQMVGLVLAAGELEFCYQHVTDEGELRSGRCRSVPEVLADGRLRLHETWKWTSGDLSEGRSIVEEVL
jgi:hypothetical protein